MSKLIENVIATFTEDKENTVAEAIRAGKVIVLYGPPACGKTRLCNALLRDVSDEDIMRINAQALGLPICYSNVLVIEDIQTSGRYKRDRLKMETQGRQIKILCSEETIIINHNCEPMTTANTPELIIIETCELSDYMINSRRFHIIEMPLTVKTPLGKNFVVRLK